MTNSLFIDTSDRDKVAIGLEIGRVKTENTIPLPKYDSRNILIAINDILDQNKLLPTDLDEIFCNPGPGSYTGLRVGASIANTLSVFLNIPLNKTKKRLVQLKYA